MIVMKFGGSSVANAEKIRQVFEIVKGRLPRKPLVIASAFRGVTDDLFKLTGQKPISMHDFVKLHAAEFTSREKRDSSEG